MLPIKASDYISTATTRSSLETESPIFDTDVSFTLSSTDRENFDKHSPSTSNLIPCKQFIDLNSQDFPEKVEAQETFNKSHLQSKFQPFNKASNFVTGKSHPKLLPNPLYEKNNSYGDLSKAKTGEIPTFLILQGK